jgi:hypothetical protein
VMLVMIPSFLLLRGQRLQMARGHKES